MTADNYIRLPTPHLNERTLSLAPIYLCLPAMIECAYTTTSFWQIMCIWFEIIALFWNEFQLKSALVPFNCYLGTL